MTQLAVPLVCSQCGCVAPLDSLELVCWRHGNLAFDPELEDVIGELLLCPDCLAEEHAHTFEEGGYE